MSEVLDNHEGSFSIEGRLITNFHFADDIPINAEQEEETDVLVDRLHTLWLGGRGGGRGKRERRGWGRGWETGEEGRE